MLRRFFVLAVLVLACFSCTKRGGGGSGANFGSGPLIEAPATPEVSSLERQMHARLNRDRAKKGLPPLAFDTELADMARAHSKDMKERDFFSHDSPFTGSLEDRLDRAGHLVMVGRENIGEGPTVDRTQDALLESPGHYANIMADDVTHVGIGIVKNGSGPTETLLVTQVFATPIRDQDAEGAKPAVAKRVADARRKAGLPALPAHPLLEKLAKQYVGDVADDLDKSSTERIGNAVLKELSGSGLTGVVVGASVFLAPAIYEPQGAVMSGSAKAVGIATTSATDERGRPAIKVLFLVGK